MLMAGSRRRSSGIPALLAGVALLLGADTARGATFTVDATLNGNDITLDGICDADSSTDTDCSLRAAVQEANNTAAADTINFKKGSVAGGDPDDVSFDPSSDPRLIDEPPPPITQPLTVDAGNCEADLDEPPKPCATVESGWVVNSPGGEVRISGLAFRGEGSGAELIAIDVVAAGGSVAALPDFTLTNSWFGLDRNGNEADLPLLEQAVLLEDVTGARIGTGFLADRNVFARQKIAIDVLGADDTEVFGNTFGLLPDGSPAFIGNSTANEEAVEVTGDSAPDPDDEATGTQIGASSPTGATTPECDLGCNEMASSGVADLVGPSLAIPAIDLGGEPADGEIPAGATEILGNQIGVTNRNTVGIAVGDADDVEIGGPAAGNADRNLLGVNEITSGAGATGLLIENNVLNGGNDSAPQLDLRGSGEVLSNHLIASGTITQANIRLSDTSAPGFTLQGNLIGEKEDGTASLSGPVAIDLTATASGNLIGGEGTGEGNVISDLIPPSPFAFPNTIGIRIAGDDNEVLGNRIGLGSNGSARPLTNGVMLIAGAGGNTIGGDTAASENVISNIGGDTASRDAIVATTAAAESNEILRNRGTDNTGLFIDLGDDGAGNAAGGPNGGAQAPVISAISPTAASGTAAPGADVRLFIKASDDPGVLTSFLAQATADGSGAWSTGLSATAGTLVAATATGAGGTSELSATATVTAPVDPVDPVEPGDSDPPETTLTRTPKKKVKAKGKGKKAKGKATYEFGADEPGSTFTCTIDRKPAAPCDSPLKLKKLKKGKHTFAVFATDAAGNADPTPATHKFKVKRKKKR